MNLLRSIIASTVLITVALTGQAAATCGIQGTISATETRTGEWTYCVDFNYFSYTPIDVLTRVSLFLPQCELNCAAGLVSFGAPAGTLNGTDPSGQACTVELGGQFWCDGDPAINAPRVPTVAWSPTDGGLCPATMPGNGQICFTLNVPPSAPREQVNAITTLSDTGQCWGTLKGVFPGCNPPVPLQNLSWSGIKAARHIN